MKYGLQVMPRLVPFVDKCDLSLTLALVIASALLLLLAASQYNQQSIKWVLEQACCLFHLSVGLSLQWLNCGKTANDLYAIWMVSAVGQGKGVLDGGGDRRRGRVSFGVNVEHPIVTHCGVVMRNCFNQTRCPL